MALDTFEKYRQFASAIGGYNEELMQELIAHTIAAEKERDALRAKIERMEKQEPVAEIGEQYTLLFVGSGSITGIAERHGIKIGDKLYARPGAQPTPIIPEGWKLVPTAESRHPGIYKMLGALHAVDNTPGASEWESYAAMLAVTPEFKP